MPEGSAAAGGHSAEGDWAAMAVWDLLTPSTSQGPVGTWLRGTLWGAAMAVQGKGGPGCIAGSGGWRRDPWLTARCLQGQATPGYVRDALLAAALKLHVCRCDRTCWAPTSLPVEGPGARSEPQWQHRGGDVTAGLRVVPTLRH